MTSSIPHLHVVLPQYVGTLDKEFTVKMHVGGGGPEQVLIVSGTVTRPELDGVAGWIGFHVEVKRSDGTWDEEGQCRVHWTGAAPSSQLATQIVLPTTMIKLATTLNAGSDSSPVEHTLRLRAFSMNVDGRLKTITGPNDLFNVAVAELDHTGVGVLGGARQQQSDDA